MSTATRIDRAAWRGRIPYTAAEWGSTGRVFFGTRGAVPPSLIDAVPCRSRVVRAGVKGKR